MRLRNMLKICLVFWKSEPQYAYKRYAYKKKHVYSSIPQPTDVTHWEYPKPLSIYSHCLN